MVVYKILFNYCSNEYYIMPYDKKGSIEAGMPKRKWWYRSIKKAQRITNAKNNRLIKQL